MVKKHDNVVILKGVQSVYYIDGSSKVTDGQPYDVEPDIKVTDGIATIIFSSGRKKSKPVADKFNSLSKNTFASQGGGGRPKELNFMFGLNVDGETIYLGQGSNSALRNNWHVGHGDGISVSALSMRTAIGKTFDQVKNNLPEPFNQVANFLGKLFGKDLFNAVNMFEIKK